MLRTWVLFEAKFETIPVGVGVGGGGTLVIIRLPQPSS